MKISAENSWTISPILVSSAESPENKPAAVGSLAVLSVGAIPTGALCVSQASGPDPFGAFGPHGAAWEFLPVTGNSPRRCSK